MLNQVSVAGSTAQGDEDNTSYIHVARLSRIGAGYNRFFEYMHTVAHEIWHQNVPTPPGMKMGAPSIEHAADAFADIVVSNYVNTQCDQRMKTKYAEYLQNRSRVGKQWSDDFGWGLHQEANAPPPF